MNQFYALHDDEPNYPQREWNSQHPESQFKSRTYPSKTNPVISDIRGILNNYAIDNGDVEFQPSEFPVESHYESFPYTDSTPIKSIDDDEIYRLLELFHSEHDEDIIDVDPQVLQY